MINEGGNETSKLSEFVDTPSCNLGKFTVNPIVRSATVSALWQTDRKPALPNLELNQYISVPQSFASQTDTDTE